MKATNRESEMGQQFPACRRGWLSSWVGAHRRAGKHDEGGTLVETAVVLPVLLLIVTGIFTFAIALNNYIELTDAVGISARTLAISRGQTTDPCSTVSAAFYKAAPTLKTASLTFSFVLNGTSYSGTSCTSGAASLVQGSSAQITATYPCNLAVYGNNYAPSCLLKSTTTEVVQ
jgi:Flp pilus assembly protein TadG